MPKNKIQTEASGNSNLLRLIHKVVLPLIAGAVGYYVNGYSSAAVLAIATAAAMVAADPTKLRTKESRGGL